MTHVYVLYVADDSELSHRAQSNFERVVRRHLEGDVELTVIDVVSDPKAAREAKVIATPLLHRLSPAPSIKILGDLGNAARVQELLGISLPTSEAVPPPRQAEVQEG